MGGARDVNGGALRLARRMSTSSLSACLSLATTRTADSAGRTRTVTAVLSVQVRTQNHAPRTRRREAERGAQSTRRCAHEMDAPDGSSGARARSPRVKSRSPSAAAWALGGAAKATSVPIKDSKRFEAPSETLMKRMGGPSDGKAGLGGGVRPKEETNRIIYEASKGDFFFFFFFAGRVTAPCLRLTFADAHLDQARSTLVGSARARTKEGESFKKLRLIKSFLSDICRGPRAPRSRHAGQSRQTARCPGEEAPRGARRRGSLCRCDPGPARREARPQPYNNARRRGRVLRRLPSARRPVSRRHSVRRRRRHAHDGQLRR